MKNLLYLFFLVSLLTACSSDDDNDIVDNNNNNVDLIFNEPLLMFGKTIEEVNSSEKRELVENTTSTYRDKKGDLHYTIVYYFNGENKLGNIYVNIPNKPVDRYNEVVNSLSKKYSKDKQLDMFYSDTYTIYPVIGLEETSWIYTPKK